MGLANSPAIRPRFAGTVVSALPEATASVLLGETVSSSPRLHREPSGVVDSLQEQRFTEARNELVDSFPRAIPMAIVIDDENASLGEPWGKMMQFVCC